MLLTVVATISSTVLVLSGIGAVLFVVLRRFERVEEAPRSDKTPYLQEIAVRLADLEVTVKGLPSLWEEERERAKQHADRAQTAYRSAEKILAAVDAEEEGEEGDEDLSGFDDDGGPSEGVLPLRDGVGSGEPTSEDALRARALNQIGR